MEELLLVFTGVINPFFTQFAINKLGVETSTARLFVSLVSASILGLVASMLDGSLDSSNLLATVATVFTASHVIYKTFEGRIKADTNHFM